MHNAGKIIILIMYTGIYRNHSKYKRIIIRGSRGGPERTGPRPPPWVPLLKNLIMVAVSFPPV